MDKKAVAGKILKIVRDQDRGFGSAKDGISVFGQPQTLQREAMQAIDAWMRQNDSNQIIGFVYMLQTQSILSEKAVNTLIDQINDAK
jgi:hypothetical protein